MKRIKEELNREIDSLFDDITVEINWIIDMVDSESSREEVIDQLKQLEEALI